MTKLVYKSFHRGDIEIIIPVTVKIIMHTVKITCNPQYIISIYTHRAAVVNKITPNGSWVD
jgi:hypothetical protein